MSRQRKRNPLPTDRSPDAMWPPDDRPAPPSAEWVEGNESVALYVYEPRPGVHQVMGADLSGCPAPVWPTTPAPPPEQMHVPAAQAVEASPCILFWGEGIYSAGDGVPVRVTEPEDNVLQAFLESPALDKASLLDKSGENRAARMLKQLQTKYDGRFGPSIRLPGRRGKGGYQVSIAKRTPPLTRT
jgi:hypothetical protein